MKKPKWLMNWAMRDAIDNTRKEPFWWPSQQATSQVSYGLTPDQLAGYLTKANNGDVRELQALYREMIEKDATLASLVYTRKLAVSSMPMEFIPIIEGDESLDTAIQIAECEKMRDQLSQSKIQEPNAFEFSTWYELIMGLLDAIPKGYAVYELGYEQDAAGFWTPLTARFVDQASFRFGGVDNLRPFEIRMITENSLFPGEELPPRVYVTAYNKNNTGYPARAGYLRAALFMYLFKNMGLKSFAAYVEKYGIPPVIIETDVQNQKAIRDMQEAIKNFGEDMALVVPKGSQPAFPTPQRGTSFPQEHIIDLVNKEYAKLILGQSATTEQAPGKLGNSSEQAELRYDIMAADATSLETVINSQIVRPFMELNHGECKVKLSIVAEQPEDMKTKAETFKILAEIKAIPEAFIDEEFNIPQPGEGDAVTSLHKKDTALFGKRA